MTDAPPSGEVFPIKDGSDRKVDLEDALRAAQARIAELEAVLRPVAAGTHVVVPARSSIQQRLKTWVAGRSEFSVEEAIAAFPDWSPKTLYNALGYRTRRGWLDHLGYGRYRLAVAPAEGGGDA